MTIATAKHVGCGTATAAEHRQATAIRPRSNTDNAVKVKKVEKSSETRLMRTQRDEVCACVCVCVRERERDRECVCLYACVTTRFIRYFGQSTPHLHAKHGRAKLPPPALCLQGPNLTSPSQATTPHNNGHSHNAKQPQPQVTTPNNHSHRSQRHTTTITGHNATRVVTGC